MKNNIAAVVVTYNRKNLLVECIEALDNQKNVQCDIMIIDNNSSDGTQETVKEIAVTNRKIKYINTGANLGGAGGFNFGIRKAVEFGYEYVWLMDDDCIPQNTALFELNEAGKRYKNFGFLSSKVLWIDGTPCVMNVQKKTSFKRMNIDTIADAEIAMATFVSCFIPIRIIKDVGLPIKDFFIWTDDLEYTLRISKKYKSYYIPNSVVIHKTKNNIGSNIAKTDISLLDRFFYRYRNEFYLYRREGFVGWIYTLIKIIYHFFIILFLSKDNKFKRIIKMFIGTLSGLFFYPKIDKIKI